MSNFVKLSALSEEDRTKLRSYWTELWGANFAAAMIEDYKPEGRSQKVQASVKTKVK